MISRGGSLWLEGGAQLSEGCDHVEKIGNTRGAHQGPRGMPKIQECQGVWERLKDRMIAALGDHTNREIK